MESGSKVKGQKSKGKKIGINRARMEGGLQRT